MKPTLHRFLSLALLAFLHIGTQANDNFEILKKAKKIDYTIKHDAMGNTSVKNMTCTGIDSLDDVEALMAKAETQRSVGQPAMNSRSSRSHSVFTLRLTDATAHSTAHSAAC